MGRFILVGDKPPTELEQWLLECMNQLTEMDAGAVACVAFPKDRDSEIGAFTASFGMGAPLLTQAATHLHFDAIDEFIRANIGRYLSTDIDEDGCGIEYDDQDYYQEDM